MWLGGQILDKMHMHYSYAAVDLQGNKLRGESHFLTKIELLKELKIKGYYLIKLNKSILSMFNIRKIKEKQLAVLCNQLAILLKAGVNISGAISITESQLKENTLKFILNHVSREILEGKQLASSLEVFNRLFPPILIQLVRAGEESGELEQVFITLSDYFEKKSKIKGKFISIILYPVMVIATSLFILLYMFINLIPSFFQTISSLNIEIPTVAITLIKISTFITNYSHIIALVLLILGVFLGKSLKTKKGRILKESIIIRTPFLRVLMLKYEIAMLCSGLSLLLKAGIPIIKALSIVKELMRFEDSKEDILFCIEQIKRGKTLFCSFKETRFNNKLFLSMVFTGEESGNLDELLWKTAAIFEDELNRTIENILTILEPALILVLGGLVCFIIFSIVSPMMNFIENIN